MAKNFLYQFSRFVYLLRAKYPPPYYDYVGCQYAYLKAYPEMRKLAIGETDKDVICKREIDDPRFNTNIANYIGLLEEMNWGYKGTGPWLLALNILYTFTDGERKFSCRYACDFVREFLHRSGNKDSFTIPAKTISAWIERKVVEARHV